MISVGIDLVEISRIENSMKNPRFLKKILGDNEYSQLEKRNFPIQSVAANFCAKEAFAKAVGTGFKNIKISDIEILRDKNNKPYVYINESLKSLNCINNKNFSVSLTHTKLYASAVVIAY